jgi:hypothetical protein
MPQNKAKSLKRAIHIGAHKTLDGLAVDLLQGFYVKRAKWVHDNRNI